MSGRSELLSSIAGTIKDYRASDLPQPTPEHIDRWIAQFDAAVRVLMLREMDYVLRRAYFSLARVTSFLRGLIRAEKLVGRDPCAFCRSVHFLDIQGGGNSQSDMLELFSEVLQETCGFRIEQCDAGSAVYVYLDDAIFTGNRIRRDLEAWIKEEAPRDATLHIVSIALHSGGQYYANGYISKAATAAGKKIGVKWWRAIQLEDRKAYSDTADVLRPTTIPNDTSVQAYVHAMRYSPTFRRAGSVGANSLFSALHRNL